MNPLLISLQTTAAAGAPDQMTMTIATFAIVILIFYFLIIRPQNKKQKDLDNLLKGVKKGDKVYTIGGMHGVVQSTNDEKHTVTLKVDEGSTTTLEFNKTAIAGLVNPPAPKKEEKKVDLKKGKKAAEATDSASEEKK